jgi:ribonucleoside-diphosphate reductase alpha chain
MSRARPGTSRALPRRVRSRDGTYRSFDAQRITDAIARAAREVRVDDPQVPVAVTDRVVRELGGRGGVPTVEQIQDAVETTLVAAGYQEVAGAYARYRQRRADLRHAKRALGVRDELKLSLSAATVLAERYLLRDTRGRIAESTGEMMDRVARHVAGAEDTFSPGASARWQEEFAGALRRLEFLPNSPTLMNAGTPLGMLSGCFVLGVDDSLESIFRALGTAALIHQAGGGTGFSFSPLRPHGDLIRSTGGAASGPVSFLRLFDVAADVVREAGRRRGANMGVLHVSHPDVAQFASAKRSPGALPHFNLSVGVTDRFMRAVLLGKDHRLVNPRTGRTVARVSAVELFNGIAEAAWESGDPGLLFLGAINRANPLPGDGAIQAANPCGEVPLLPDESCNLGSVNLARFVHAGRVDEQRLAATVRLAVRFLDDVVEANRYPNTTLEEAARRTRKIGLGVMGLAELLAALGVPYASTRATRVAGRLMALIDREARIASVELACERGPFPAFEHSVYADRGHAPLRNAQLTSIAPTGTISLIAGTTSGIEPLFAVAYLRIVLGGRIVQVNPLFEAVARQRGFYSDQLIADLAGTGSIAGDQRVPPDVRQAFPTALDLTPADHLRMQAAVQRHTHAGVSKTVNLPATATVDDIRELYMLAWRLRVKGVTAYRYGSRPEQVLQLLSSERHVPGPPVLVDVSYTGGCPASACHY